MMLISIIVILFVLELIVFGIVSTITELARIGLFNHEKSPSKKVVMVK